MILNVFLILFLLDISLFYARDQFYYPVLLLGKFLGKGGFAKCYEMKCVETNKIFAAKLFVPINIKLFIFVLIFF